MAFEIKRNDRRPRWRANLTENGENAPLTGALAARFTMADASTSTVKIDRAAMSIEDAAAGLVEYAWEAGDTDTVGTYNVEVEVEWSAGVTQTFPSKGYFTVTVYEDLDAP